MHSTRVSSGTQLEIRYFRTGRIAVIGAHFVKRCSRLTRAPKQCNGTCRCGNGWIERFHSKIAFAKPTENALRHQFYRRNSNQRHPPCLCQGLCVRDRNSQPRKSPWANPDRNPIGCRYTLQDLCDRVKTAFESSVSRKRDEREFFPVAYDSDRKKAEGTFDTEDDHVFNVITRGVFPEPSIIISNRRASKRSGAFCHHSTKTIEPPSNASSRPSSVISFGSSTRYKSR